MCAKDTRFKHWPLLAFVATKDILPGGVMDWFINVQYIIMCVSFQALFVAMSKCLKFNGKQGIRDALLYVHNSIVVVV